MYRYLTVRNVSSYNAQKIWNCKMPLEVNIFLWQALHEKIQSAAEEKGKITGSGVNSVLYVVSLKV